MRMSSTTSSWSASRKPPAKGCLSHTKTKRKTSPTIRVVQFGSPRAVEFDASQPSTQHFLTPLPSEVTRQRYSMTKKKQNSTTATQEEEDARMSEETKRNSALLAEWEDQEDGPLRATSSAEAKRRRQGRQNHRRSSSLFTPSPNATSLLDNNDDNEDHWDPHHHNEDTTTTSTVAAPPPPKDEPSPPSDAIASLCGVLVDSPLLQQQQQQEQPNLTPASSGSTSSGSSDEESSPSSSSSQKRNMEGGSTTEWAVPLNEVHVHGAAATTMRRQRKKNPPPPHTTQHYSSLSFPSIVPSVGDAWGKTTRTTTTTTTVDNSSSTSTTRRHLSPIISQRSATTTKKKSRILPTTTTLLLQDPVGDVSDILWALATSKDQQHNNTIQFSSKDTNHPQMLIQAVLNPHWDGVVSCLEDLHEQVRFCANTKSHTKFKLPSSQQGRAQSMVLREWNQLELEFISELTQVLERNTAHAQHLCRKACHVLETSRTTTSTRTDMSTNRPNKNTRQQLERDIAKLEETIHEQEERFKIQEAAEAPYSSLFCQATSHMGICGFRFETFQETTCTLQLAYEHPIIAGVVAVETQCTFDMLHNEWNAKYCSLSEGDAVLSSSPDLLPLPATTSHPAAQFHQHIATTWFANHHHVSNGTGLWRRLVGDLPLQDALMTLSEWLGELDAITQDLVELSKTHGLVVEWPRLILSIHDDDDDDATTTTTLTLVHDEECIRNNSSLLGPIRCILTQNGTETPMMNVLLRCGEKKQHLVSSILHDCLRKSSTREK